MAIHDYNIANASGLSFRADINAVLQAILTNNSSATTPTTTQPFMWWYDTTTSLLKMRNSGNTTWDTVVPVTASLASKLVTARTINGVSFDGSANINIEDRKGSNIASVATTVIGTSGIGDYIHITGTTGITSFGTASVVGVRRTLIFDGALTITHNASTLICVGSANIVTVANTVIEVVAETTTSWRVISITHPALGISELSYLDGVTSAIQTQLDAKQATLVGGTNIKTINGISPLGSGDIAIQSDSVSTIFANSQTFTASGTFTVPAGVTQLMVFIASGGGGGGGGKAFNSSTSASGGGGGASAFFPPMLVAVTALSNIPVVIGTGGAGGVGLAYSQSYTIGNGGNGGSSSFGSIAFNGSKGGFGANATGTGGNAGANGGNGVVGSLNSTVSTNGINAVGGLGYTNATGGNTGTGSAGGIGGTSNVINGANGVAGVNGWGGAGGAGGAGKVVVYW